MSNPAQFDKLLHLMRPYRVERAAETAASAHRDIGLKETSRASVKRQRRHGDIKPIPTIVALALAALFAYPAQAVNCMRDKYGDLFCGRGQCAMDAQGKVYCSQEGGGAILDRYGTVVCGVGYCAMDGWGRVRCSSTAAGDVLLDKTGEVQCSEGCREASAQLCEEAHSYSANVTPGSMQSGRWATIR